MTSPPPPSRKVCSVAVLGFSDFERATLQAFFRLAARRYPAYVEAADPASAEIVLVDADDAAAMADERADVSRCVYVGAHGRDGQLGHSHRPINAVALLKQLDQGVARLAAAAPTAGDSPTK